MNEKHELTDEQIEELHWGELSNRGLGFARAIIAADRTLRASPAAGDVVMQPEPTNEMYAAAQSILLSTGDEDCAAIMMNTSQVRSIWRAMSAAKPQQDAQAAIAAKDAEIARLQSDLARPESLAVGLMRAEIAALTAERDAAMAASRYETDLCGQALTDLKKMTADMDALRKDAV